MPEKERLPEVQKFLDAFDEFGGSGYGGHYKVQEAWVALERSEDKLVRWIAQNAIGYRAMAAEVLSRLPCTLTELDKLAQERNWCEVWDRFRKKAIEDEAIKVDLDIEMKVNGDVWASFFAFELPNGDRLTKDKVMALFVAGAHFVQLDVGHAHIMYQLKRASVD